MGGYLRGEGKEPPLPFSVQSVPVINIAQGGRVGGYFVRPAFVESGVKMPLAVFGERAQLIMHCQLYRTSQYKGIPMWNRNIF